MPLKLDYVKYLICKVEPLRANNINRARSLITASSLLITGNTVLMRSFFDHIGLISFSSLLVINILSMILCYGFSIFALIFSIGGIVNLFSSRRHLFMKHIPSRLFGHAGETINRFGDNFSDFQKQLESCTDEDLANYLSSDLYSIYLQHTIRYSHLRFAGWLLILSAICLLINVITSIYGYVK